MEDFKIWIDTEEEKQKVLQKMERDGIKASYGHLPTDLKGKILPCPIGLHIKSNVLYILTCYKDFFTEHYTYLKTITPEEYLKEETEMKDFTLADLKEKMIIETRDGDRYMYLNNIGVGKDTYLSFVYTRLDLTSTISKDFDIVKVYNCGTLGSFTWLLQNPGKLIWEREEAKEMTVAEIEKALGYPVKIVKE